MSYEAPFAGIKVVDVSQGIAGPYAAMLLAQYGADVIKVESLDGGDWVRATAPEPGGNTPLSVMGNLGKRSIALDLKKAEGVALLWRLLDGADVFMEGFRPTVIERLGFGYAAVAARHPRILYVSMSGFGQSGPYAERPAMDPVLQAFSGFMAENVDASGRPLNVASIPVDILSSLFVYQALSSALYARRDEARGRYIEASLIEGAAWLNTYAMLQRIITGANPPGSRSRGVYRTADGYILSIVAGRRGWTDFCTALGQPALGADPRFMTVKDRVANAEALSEVLDEAFSVHPNAYWGPRLTEYGVMHSIVNESLDVLNDPHVQAIGLFSQTVQPGLGMKVPIPSIPGAPPIESGTLRGTAPLSGGDTDAILAAHGFGAAEIAGLKARGVVGTAG
jgi:crotonobetainyl-CoA:carnitine CoA-transferase CaiB-like acyl-CoA transferase